MKRTILAIGKDDAHYPNRNEYIGKEIEVSMEESNKSSPFHCISGSINGYSIFFWRVKLSKKGA